MATLATCLWFDGEAEEAAGFYVSLLPDSRIDLVRRMDFETPGRTAGDVISVEFTLAGAAMTALNGGRPAGFTPAISLAATCADQAELDRLWAALADGGETLRCGWLTDRFGVSWQIVPAELGEMLADADAAQTDRLMQAMLGMAKLEIDGLRRAFEG